MGDAELLANTPVFVLARRDDALRARVRADWADAGVAHVRFVDALLPADPHDKNHPCVAAYDVSTVGCPHVRAVMSKRVGQTCSQIWRLQNAVVRSGSPFAVLLEDDVVLRPNRTAFRALLPRLLRALHARKADGRSWDVAFLGSCFERLIDISRCEELGATSRGGAAPHRLWLSNAVQPLCMHGLVVTPHAAHTLRAAMSDWLARYHDVVARYYANSTLERGAATCEGLRWVKGMAFAINGHDLPLRNAVRSQILEGLHAWPQLVEQASKVEPRRAYLRRHKFYNYLNGMPTACARASMSWHGG